MERVELVIDVTEAAGLGEEARLAVTVHTPSADVQAEPPVVAFAKAGAGFSRGYYTERLPGRASSQAEWHAARGWIFASVDHLGTGDSSTHDAGLLTYRRLAATAAAAEEDILRRLANGGLGPAITQVPVRLGIGQSMGGCLTVVQQAHHRGYDGIAVLGFSAVHTQPPVPPGEQPVVAAWVLRDSSADEPPVVLNVAEVAAAQREGELPQVLKWLNWHFYGDDLDPASFDNPSRWQSAGVPGLIRSILTPGVIASEAAAITVPVLVAMGERDVVPDPKEELRAYRSANSLDLFVCPRMAHMHNFAPTAELLWHRLDRWGRWVSDMRGR